jgi:lipopolysaccharide O-acetyltransferase
MSIYYFIAGEWHQYQALQFTKSNLKFKKMYRTYGIFGLGYLALYWLLTKIFFPTARLVRFPIFIRGKSSIKFGEQFTTGRHVRIDAYPKNKNSKVIFIGKNVQINDSVHIAAIEHIEIGDNTLLASRVFITDHNHGEYNFCDFHSRPETPPINRTLVSKPVYIGSNVWIGEQACILPGVTIGDGVVIGANSVVTKNILPNTIVAGNPAKAIKRFDLESGLWVRI